MKAVEFFIPGAPRGKGRARSAPLMRGGQPVLGKGGRPIVTHHTDEKTVAYESTISIAGANAMMVARLAEPMDGGVALTLDILLEVPRSWSKKKRVAALAGLVFATKKPDSDNVLKAVKDGLNSIVWRDDVQVVRTVMQKRFAEAPGVRVRVLELAGERA